MRADAYVDVACLDSIIMMHIYLYISYLSEFVGYERRVDTMSYEDMPYKGSKWYHDGASSSGASSTSISAAPAGSSSDAETADGPSAFFRDGCFPGRDTVTTSGVELDIRMNRSCWI